MMVNGLWSQIGEICYINHDFLNPSPLLKLLIQLISWDPIFSGFGNRSSNDQHVSQLEFAAILVRDHIQHIP